MSSRTNPVLVCIVLLCAVAYVTLQQAYWGMKPTYGFDEYWHTVFAALSPAWRAFLTMSDDTHPFLYYLFLRPFVHASGDPFFPRLLSILPTILTLPLWFLLLQKLRVGTAMALLSTVILAISFPFLDMGVMVRSYSLTVFLLLLGIWFWADMTPGGGGRPSRLSAWAGPTLFGIAFLCLYAAGFVSGALFAGTLVVMAVDRPLRQQILDNWRRYGGWGPWVLFLLLHLVGVGWFILGLRNELDAVIPGHVRNYVLLEGQTVGEFLLRGLRHELALFTSFRGDRLWLLDAGWTALLLLAVWVSYRAIRSANAIAAVVALSPIFLTAVLAVLGLVRHYPFGGELRHQYVLFPLLLLLVALALDLLWQKLDRTAARTLLVALVFTAAATVSYRSLRIHGSIGEAPAQAWWGEDFEQLFESGTELPVILPQYSFYAAFMNRWTDGIRYQTSYNCDQQGCTEPTQGWRALTEPRPQIQQYRVTVHGGKDIRLLEYYQWAFPTPANPPLLASIKRVIETLDAPGARVFSPDGSADRADKEDQLRTLAARHGLRLTEYRLTPNGIIWSLLRDSDQAATRPPVTGAQQP